MGCVYKGHKSQYQLIELGLTCAACTWKNVLF